MRTNMFKRMIVSILIFLMIGQNAFAAASSAHVTAEATRVIMTVNMKIQAAASSIVGALNSLLRDNKGMNVAQAVREFQSTSSQDSANLAKQITAALDAHLAGMAVQDQRRDSLLASQEAESRALTVTPDECAKYAMKKTAPLAQATQAAYSAAGGNVGRTATGGVSSVYEAAKNLMDKRKADPRSLDAGIVTKPGCEPQMSDETAYAAEMAVVGGYECAGPNLTIPEKDGEKAADFIARMVVPHPIPSLPLNVRGTTSGALYEAERDLVRMRQSYLIDIGQDSLSKFQATRDISENKEFFSLMGVDAFVDGGLPNKVSEMDYLRYHLLSRWDNPKFQELQNGKDTGGLLKDVNDSLLLLATIQFRQLELAERKIPAEMGFFEAVQDGPSRTKLQELRLKAGL